MSQKRLDLKAIEEASKHRVYLDQLDLKTMWEELDLLGPEDKES